MRLTLFTFTILTLLYFISCGERKVDVKNDQVKTNQTTQTQNTKQTNMTDTTKPKVDSTKDNKTDEGNKVIMKTSMGEIEIELYEKDAPQHVANFKKLVKSGFYNGLTFHRVIPNFMIQGGDPNSKDKDRSNDGQGGPGYTIPAEIKLKHQKGSLAAARLGDQVNPKRESSGSQFYIVTGDASHLDGQYTVFGKVIKGYEICEKIQNVKKDGSDNPIEKVEIEKISFAK